MSEQKALSLYSGRNVPSELASKNAAKLIEALSFLGSKHVLKTFVQKLDNPPQFILKGN